MLKKFKFPILALAALTALTPGSAFARDHWREHHHPHVRVYVGPSYPYGYYGYYGYHRGYYDAWGYWHPY
jgi:hypothetical protein